MAPMKKYYYLPRRHSQKCDSDSEAIYFEDVALEKTNSLKKLPFPFCPESLEVAIFGTDFINNNMPYFHKPVNCLIFDWIGKNKYYTHWGNLFLM